EGPPGASEPGGPSRVALKALTITPRSGSPAPSSWSIDSFRSRENYAPGVPERGLHQQMDHQLGRDEHRHAKQQLLPERIHIGARSPFLEKKVSRAPTRLAVQRERACQACAPSAPSVGSGVLSIYDQCRG